MAWIIIDLRATRGDRPLFWSNAMGWVDIKSADKFTTDEKRRLNLPMGGHWIDESDARILGDTTEDDDGI